VNGTARHSVPVGEIRRLGDHALLVGVEGTRAARTLTRAVHASGIAGVTEVVGGLATVMVAIDAEEGDLGLWRRLLARLLEESSVRSDDEADEGEHVVIPCAFEGPDLDEVADLIGCTPETVIELVTARPLTVAVVGFSPGFAYLDGLPPELCQIPRRSRPRPAVTPGSVALANGHAAVYPTASPGGWQLIGHTEVQLFTPWEAPYARLAPGDRVQFTRAPQGVTGGPSPGAPGRSLPIPSREDYPSARPVFVVEEAGLRTVPQDGGRRGLASLGVPTASPGDPVSFRLANQLVGNAIDACALEVTARGPSLSCVSSTFVAVVGASPDLRLQGQPVATGRVVPVNAGQRLVVGAVRGGFRSYIAVAGGLVGPEVFGSQSSDLLAGLGPGPLTVGARLWVAAMEPPLGDHLREGIATGVANGEPVSLRVVPGPHLEHFSAGAFASLGSMRFTVEAESNRVGLRLRRHPDVSPVDRAPETAAELDSQGMVTGAVQMPPNGEPVILLTDHATLGGYPVIAVVAAVDHGKLGQCAPGATIVFDPIDHGEADDAFVAQQRNLDSAVSGRYPLVVE
jgi:KipI family sensor histidine kinase inhibitor